MLRERHQGDCRGKLYERVAEDLRRAISLGHFRAGEQLPSTRRLATSIGVSRNTVLMAYRILGLEQLTSSRERGRVRVANISATERSGSTPKTVDPQSRYAARARALESPAAHGVQKAIHCDMKFSASLDHDLRRMWSRKLAIAARAVGTRYPDPQGFLPLRSAVADWLARDHCITCTANDILIVRGMQQAMAIAARVLLNEGDVAAVEDPALARIRETLIAHGAQVIGIRTDEHGIVVDELARDDPRLICVSVWHQIASNSTVAADRRADLLKIAFSRGRWILECDFSTEFQTGKRSVATLRSLDRSGVVMYACPLWEPLFPSLHLAFVVCPPGIRDDLCAAKRLTDLGCSLAEQAALAALIRNQQYDRWVRRCAAKLEHCRIVFQKAVLCYCGDRVLIEERPGEPNVIVWLRYVSYSRFTRLVELGNSRSLVLCPAHTEYQRRPERPGLLFNCVNQPAEALTRLALLLGKCLDELDAEQRVGRANSDGRLVDDSASAKRLQR
jgi:GntR family transcriptional regulator/MocR family aminotransferase